MERVIHPTPRDVELEPGVDGDRITGTGDEATGRDRNISLNQHVAATGFDVAGVVRPNGSESYIASGRERHRPLDPNLPQTGEIQARKSTLLQHRGIDDQGRFVRLTLIQARAQGQVLRNTRTTGAGRGRSQRERSASRTASGPNHPLPLAERDLGPERCPQADLRGSDLNRTGATPLRITRLKICQPRQLRHDAVIRRTRTGTTDIHQLLAYAKFAGRHITVAILNRAARNVDLSTRFQVDLAIRKKVHVTALRGALANPCFHQLQRRRHIRDRGPLAGINHNGLAAQGRVTQGRVVRQFGPTQLNLDEVAFHRPRHHHTGDIDLAPGSHRNHALSGSVRGFGQVLARENVDVAAGGQNLCTLLDFDLGGGNFDAGWIERSRFWRARRVVEGRRDANRTACSQDDVAGGASGIRIHIPCLGRRACSQPHRTILGE